MASYRKRENGKWEYRISYKTADGKYKKKEKGGFTTKKAAQIEAAKIEADLEIAMAEDTTSTLVDFFINWATVHKKPHVHPNTWHKYEYTHLHIQKLFKDTKLSKITSTIYQNAINDLCERYSQQTVVMIHKHIKQAVRLALHDGRLKHDFSAMAVVKSKKETKDEKEFYLESHELLQLINKTSEHPEWQSHFFNYTIAKTGLRFSEGQGLTKDCIDTDNRLIRVYRTYKVAGKTRGWDKLKNEQSAREIPINDDFIKQYQLYLEKGYKENPDHRLFTNVSNTAANVTLRKLVGRKTHIHALRHSYASYLISQGIEILTVSKILGHKDLTETIKTYTHELESAKQENFEKIRGIFGAE